MSDYKRVSLFIFLLVVLSIAIVCIVFSLNPLENSMLNVGNGIANGDKDYNDAVNLINNKSYDEALNKALSASDNYNKTLIELSDIQNNRSENFNNIYKEYISTTINEVELKSDAASDLSHAIYYFKNNNNSTGSSYGSEANDLMDEAIEYQNARNTLVEDNPNLFR